MNITNSVWYTILVNFGACLSFFLGYFFSKQKEQGGGKSEVGYSEPRHDNKHLGRLSRGA